MTLNRRELTGYFLTFGLAVPTVGTMAILPSGVAAPGIAANAPGRTVKLHDGTVVPALKGAGGGRKGGGGGGGVVPPCRVCFDVVGLWDWKGF